MIAVSRFEPHLNGTAKHVPEANISPAIDTPPAVEMALLRVLAEIGGKLHNGQSWSVRAGELELTLSVGYPQAKPPKAETECEEDTLAAVTELVERHGRRVTMKEVLAHLAATDRLWGRSTALNALATLVHRGLLTNLRNKKGYGLPEGGAS
jgi:hypothetical protein